MVAFFETPNAKFSSGGLLRLSCLDATDEAAVCCNVWLGHALSARRLQTRILGPRHDRTLLIGQIRLHPAVGWLRGSDRAGQLRAGDIALLEKRPAQGCASRNCGYKLATSEGAGAQVRTRQAGSGEVAALEVGPAAARRGLD